MPLPIPKTESRSKNVLQRHYKIEKALANRLRKSSKTARRELYGEVYDEFFRQVTDLPKAADNPRAQRQLVELQTRALLPFITDDSVFLEVGAGDCALALNMAAIVRRVYAIDASVQAVGDIATPVNFELIVSGSNPIPLDDKSIDLAYSCHFIEHLHPDDALDHASEIRRILQPGGFYQCVTPNRLWGPHDISRFFDDVPTGFHLREYTHIELARLFQKVGFHNTKVLRSIDRAPSTTPLWPYSGIEGFLSLLPVTLRRHVMARLLKGNRPPFRPLEQVIVVAQR